MDEKNLSSLSEHGEQSKKVTLYLVMTAIVCFAGSSLQFGYNLAVINAPAKIIKIFFKDVKNFSTFLWPLSVAIFAIGGMVGAFIGPHIARKIGRKKALMINNLLAISGGIFLACTKPSHSIVLLIIGRILVGLNAGVNTVVAPMYLSEIAPVRLRGALGTLNQFGIVSGILFANILGLPEVLGNISGWPYLLGVTTAIAVVQLCLLPFCPESPRYLLINKQDEFAASTNLQKLRGYENVSEEMDEMKKDAARESAIKNVTVFELFRNSNYHKPLLISIVMQLAQQLSGIGGILSYSTDMFMKLGVTDANSQAATCGVGALSVLMTALAVVLVEVAGRRFLMLLGLGGMAIMYIVVIVAMVLSEESWAKYLAVVSTLASVAAFQIGPGAIPWFIVAELFTQSSIAAAISIAGPINWLGNFAVNLIFPLLQDNIDPYTFVPFLALLVFFFLFTYFYVPETKGRSVGEIAAGMNENETEERLLTNQSHSDD